MPDKGVFLILDEWPGVPETARVSIKVPVIKHHPNGPEVKMTHRARGGSALGTCTTHVKPWPSRKRHVGLEMSKKEGQILEARPELYSLPQ